MQALSILDYLHGYLCSNKDLNFSLRMSENSENSDFLNWANFHSYELAVNRVSKYMQDLHSDTAM